MKNAKLYVGNLDYSVDLTELKELFSNYGEVNDIKIIKDKGFGFVEMTRQIDAESAMKELNGADFKGRKLKINEAKPQQNKKSRPGQNR